MALNADLLDKAIRHQIGLLRYSNATVRKMLGILNNSEARLVEQLRKYDPLDVSGSWSQKRLAKLLEQVRSTQREAYEELTRQLRNDLKALVAYEAEYQQKVLQSFIPIEFDIITPAPTQLFAAVEARPFQGRLLKEWGSELEESAFRRVRDEIRSGYLEGRTTDQIIRDIIGTRSANYSDGIIQHNRRSTEMMVRTSINHTANVARQQTYADNGDVIKGWRFVATLDNRTSVTCASLDGTVWDLGQGPQPPRHPNCRSTTVPVTKSWKELGFDIDELDPATRASMDGQVPESETYNSWLGHQSAEFQDDILGATRAELFRNGGLTLDRFTDREGVEYTLDELRSRETDAFARAFG